MEVEVMFWGNCFTHCVTFAPYKLCKDSHTGIYSYCIDIWNQSLYQYNISCKTIKEVCNPGEEI